MKRLNALVRCLCLAAVLLAASGCPPLNHDGSNMPGMLGYNYDYSTTNDKYYTWIHRTGRVKYYTVYDLKTDERTFSSYAVNNEKMFIHSSYPWVAMYSSRHIAPDHFVSQNENARVKMPVYNIAKFVPQRDLGDGDNIIEATDMHGQKFIIRVSGNLAQSIGNMEMFRFREKSAYSGQEEIFSIQEKNIISIEFN